MNKREIAGYTRIQKRTAAKLYNEGEPIYLLPVNLHPANPWHAPHRMQINDFDPTDLLASDIENRIAYYTVFNCQYNQAGLYPAYYIRKDDTQEGRP